MKKFIAIFPIIVVLIMSNMVGLAAHAASTAIPTTDGRVSTEATYAGYFEYREAEDFSSFVSDTGDYFVYKGYYEHSSVDDYFYSTTLYIPLGSTEEVVKEDGILNLITSDSSIPLYYAGYKNDCRDGIPTPASGAIVSSNNRFSAKKWTYNPDTHEIFGYDSSDNEIYHSILAYTTAYCTMTNVDGGLDLSVSFTPSLSGEVDRTIEQNGVQAESDYFSMTITNNSSENAQFLMAIVPTGSSSNFVNNTADAVGVEFFPDKQIFTLMYKEWQYAPLITGTTVSKAFEKEYYQTSGWHIVSGNSTYTRQFNWKQINLQADTSYDVVVVAIPTEFSKPSIVFTQSDCEHYLDTSEGVEVYRSTFTVLNPAEYDSTCTDFGNVIGSTMVGESEKAEAYVDDNGEVVVDDVSASELLEDRGTWEPGIIENSVELFSLEGVQALFDSCGNVINFIGYSFVFMPSWYWIILLFGITAVVAIGIIKALKG